MKRYDDVVEFHGHSCPGLALGYRVSRLAMREFKSRAEDEELVALVENNSCAIDAVQVLTGCTFGKGNLIFRDYGKQVYTFIRRPTGRSLRISVIWERPAETAAEKKLWTAYAKGDRTRKVIEFVNSKKAEKIRMILDAEDDELFAVTRGKGALPEEAEIFESVWCAVCGEKVARPKTLVKDGLIVCLPCFERKGKSR